MSNKVLELVRGNEQKFAQTVYGDEYVIEYYNPFETHHPAVLASEDESYIGVFAYNILTAYSWRDSLAVVKEWARVLEKGGLLHILVPSQRWLGKLMMQHTEMPAMRPLLFGDQSGYTGSLNLSCYNMVALRVHIEACGLALVTAKTGKYDIALGDEKFEAEQLYVAGQKI